MTEAHVPAEKKTVTKHNATNMFNYTMIADQLRTVSWSNYSQQTGVVN